MRSLSEHRFGTIQQMLQFNKVKSVESKHMTAFVRNDLAHSSTVRFLEGVTEISNTGKFSLQASNQGHRGDKNAPELHRI